MTGDRDTLVDILTQPGELPGWVMYLVAIDETDSDLIWVLEVWDSETSHKASLKLPSVQEAIQNGRPHISKFRDSRQIGPVEGGLGVPGKR